MWCLHEQCLNGYRRTPDAMLERWRVCSMSRSRRGTRCSRPASDLTCRGHESRHAAGTSRFTGSQAAGLRFSTANANRRESGAHRLHEHKRSKQGRVNGFHGNDGSSNRGRRASAAEELPVPSASERADDLPFGKPLLDIQSPGSWDRTPNRCATQNRRNAGKTCWLRIFLPGSIFRRCRLQQSSI